MRVAVISDVHANYRALEAVLAEIEAADVEAVWCLGDTVGYGPRPNECCEEVERRATICLIGNHDLVALGELSIGEFNHEAAAAAVWTADNLTERSRDFLQRLRPSAETEGVDMFHASARDPVWEYVLGEDAARTTFELTDTPLVLVGHSHVALALSLDTEFLGGGLAPAGTELQLSGRWLLNPGSVGQPRDGDPRAAWLLLDLEAMFAAFQRVEYPIRQTQMEMRERGLPAMLADRLARGE